MITESYVSFETANMLEEAGFDEACDSAYNIDGKISYMGNINSTLPYGYISRPTQSLAARWLREVHGFHLYSKRCYNYNLNKYTWGFWIQRVKYDVYVNFEIGFDSQEETIEAGLQEALRIIIKNKEQ